MKYFKELFYRLLLVIFCGITTSFTMYFYKEIILFEVLIPSLNYNSLNSNYYIFTNITELFVVYLNLIFFLSTQLVIIYSLWNFYIFLSPGLYLFEYYHFKFFLQLLFFSYLISNFFLIHLWIPFLWNFFLSFQTKLMSHSVFMHFETKVSEYIMFFIETYFVSILQFQILTILILFFIYYPINKIFIKKYRKIFYFSFLLIATIFTPPDLISQIVVLFITIFCFELIILCLFLFKKLVRKPIKA